MCELGGRMYRKGTRNTFSSCPFLCFTQNGQNNVTDGPAATRPDPPPVLAPKGRTEMPRNIFQWRISARSSKKTIPASNGNLAIPMHIPDGEITDFRKRHQIGLFTSSATVSGSGSSTSSGAKPSTAVNGPRIHQREGQQFHGNLKDMKQMHDFT